MTSEYWVSYSYLKTKADAEDDDQNDDDDDDIISNLLLFFIAFVQHKYLLLF